MKAYETDCSEMIAALIRQLADMNSKMEGIEKRGIFTNRQWDYLFGFDPDSSSRKEDYIRYLTFKKAMTELMEEFGIHYGMNGYTYMIEAVMIIIDLSSLDLVLRDDVYPLIAEKHNYANVSAVEHNIRNAIAAAYKDLEKSPGSNRMHTFGKRPTPRHFLYYLTETVCQKMCIELNGKIC